MRITSANKAVTAEDKKDEDFSSDAEVLVPGLEPGGLCLLLELLTPSSLVWHVLNIGLYICAQ